MHFDLVEKSSVYTVLFITSIHEYVHSVSNAAVDTGIPQLSTGISTYNRYRYQVP
jgi:hypothetical protein